jgi:hypothetical protein
MKNLLSTTALIAGIAFGGAAFAQAITEGSVSALYTWVDASGNLREGTFNEFTTLITAPAVVSAPGAAPVASDFATPEAFDTALTAYNTSVTNYQTYLAAVAAYNESLASLTLLTADDAAPYTATSLLDGILSNASALSSSISNISQNLNDIDGSINVDTDRTIAEMTAVITALKGENPGFGSFSQVNPNVYASDLPASLLAVLNPLTLELGNLSTTAIGTLQSGNMTGKFDADGLVSKVTSAAGTGTSTNTSMLAEQYASIAGTIAMQNVSVNSGAINGTVNLLLDDVNTKVGTVATTAIGALQSGTMNADIAGAMGAQSQTLTTGIVTALVGPVAN